MTVIRQWLYFAALIAACAGVVWVQSIRLDAAEASAVLQQDRAQQAAQRAESIASELDRMTERLHTEQREQAELAATQQYLQLALHARQQHIEDLKRENQQLRDWTALPLPDAARRLRQRPAIAGADGYREWLSRRDAVPTAGGEPKE